MFDRVRVLLDTHSFINLSLGGLENVTPSVRKIVADEEIDLLLSSISITEIAIKSVIGKLSFGSDSIKEGVKLLRLTVIPYTLHHAQFLFTLPFYADHRDPFDRMLIATALAEDVAIVSKDKQFKRYKALTVIRLSRRFLSAMAYLSTV